jgi:hypothetical protein
MCPDVCQRHGIIYASVRPAQPTEHPAADTARHTHKSQFVEQIHEKGQTPGTIATAHMKQVYAGGKQQLCLRRAVQPCQLVVFICRRLLRSFSASGAVLLAHLSKHRHPCSACRKTCLPFCCSSACSAKRSNRQAQRVLS